MKILSLFLLHALFFITDAHAQEASTSTAEFDLDKLVWLIIGSVIGAVISVWVFRFRDKYTREKDKEDQQLKALQSIHKELQLILNILENEESSSGDLDKNIPYVFQVVAWNANAGVLELPSEAFGEIQEAYSAISKINRYAPHAWALFSANTGPGSTTVTNQKIYAKNDGVKYVTGAIAVIENKLNEVSD